MNKDDKLIETLLNATEKKKVAWHLENWAHNTHLFKTYQSTEVLVLKVDKDVTVLLLKYGTIEEKVDFLLFDKRKGMELPMLVIEEEDIERPHRLWTLFKLATRNASGLDNIIDDIISKFEDDLPPF